jgi:hypothetical protein
MFGRLRLVGRGTSVGSVAARRAARGRTSRTISGGVDVKALLSAALAHPPTWTNTLPVADPKGRAANTSAVFPAAPLGAPDAAKGGTASWPTSAAPR